MTKPVHLPMIGLFVLAQFIGFAGAARADDIDVHVEASTRHFQCLAYARAGADLRAAFDAAVAANIDVGVRSQLLIRAAAAFRAGELWADAAAALEAYAALQPIPFDARFRLAEALQLRAFARGDMSARLEGDLDLDGLIDGDLDFDGVVDATVSARVPRPNIDPRFGLDLDADGDLDVFIGASLGRIATLLGTLSPRVEADISARADAGIDFAALGASFRAAFDASAHGNIVIGARAQLLLRAAAAFRRAELWADAALALESYTALVPPALDVRLRAGEAVQLRAFAAGNLNARLDTGLGLGGLIGGAVSLDHRYGMDFDADGALETLIGVPLAQIALALGTAADLPGIEAIHADVPEVDLGNALDADLDPDADLPSPRLRLVRGLGIGIGTFGGAVGFVGMGVGLRAHGIHGDLPIDLTTPSAQAQLALEAKMRKALKGVLITGAIVVTGVVTAIVIIAVRARHGVDADLELDCETGWQLAPGPGLAGLGIARTF